MTLPPGAERAARLAESITDLDAAIGRLRQELPQVNDAALRPRVVAFVEAGDAMLAEHGSEAGPEVVDRLNALLNGVHQLEIPARDPELGPTPTLERIEQATGLIAIRLIRALDAAAALGWLPIKPELPQRLTASVAREEVGGLLDRIADRLEAVGASLDALVAASDGAGGPSQQKGLVNFYVGSLRIEINLAKMQLRVGERSVDFAALWRAAETIADLTGDFLVTIHAWAQRVSTQVVQAAETVRQRVRKIVSGVGTTIGFVARNRRRADRRDPRPELEQVYAPADDEVPPRTAPPFAPPPDFDLEEALRMLRAGRVLPEAWRPFIFSLDLHAFPFDQSPRSPSLAVLDGLINLQHLNLSNTRISDLGPLAGLARLRRLYLKSAQVKDLSWITSLTHLQRLDLEGSQVSDVSPLAGLSNLQRLDLDGTQVSDVSPLAGLINLQELNLEGTQVIDVSPLARLTNLQQLNLGRTRVSDVSPLGALVKLLTLELKDTRVSDTSPLAALTRLQRLVLWNTPSGDASVLATLRELKYLDLDNTGISDLSPLAGLSQLETLGLNETQVRDLYPLQGLVNLQHLELHHSQVIDLSPLARLIKLEVLYLGSTLVSDVSALAGLTGLRHLHLKGTQVGDVSALASLTQLEIER